MSRRVKEFVDIEDHLELDALIGRLCELRESLPADADPELRLRGDEVFGRRITISYFRPLTRGRSRGRAALRRANARSQAARARAAPGRTRSCLLFRAGQAQAAAHRRLGSRSGRAEVERQAVHAIAQAGRPRPVVEDVAEVPATARAQHFGSGREPIMRIGPFHHGAGQRPPETRPPGPALELGRRAEQRLRATRAGESPAAISFSSGLVKAVSVRLRAGCDSAAHPAAASTARACG